MNSDHPAVLAHHEEIIKASGEPNDSSETIPNHAELSPYLAQLPRNKEYTIVDPESGHYDWDSLSHWQESLNRVGLDVMWSDDNRGYGGCQMTTDPQGNVGLLIYVNGCSGQSAPVYYVVPKDALRPDLSK